MTFQVDGCRLELEYYHDARELCTRSRLTLLSTGEHVTNDHAFAIVPKTTVSLLPVHQFVSKMCVGTRSGEYIMDVKTAS